MEIVELKRPARLQDDGTCDHQYLVRESPECYVCARCSFFIEVSVEEEEDDWPQESDLPSEDENYVEEEEEDSETEEEEENAAKRVHITDQVYVFPPVEASQAFGEDF